MLTNLIVTLWLLSAALVWRTVPLPQAPIVNFRRSYALAAQPWRGRVAVGLRIELVLLSR